MAEEGTSWLELGEKCKRKKASRVCYVREKGEVI